METEEWVKDEKYYNTFYKIKKFNSTFYKIELWVDCNAKSYKVWIAISSGKKRKNLENFMPDELFRDGGIKALLWVKKEFFNFPFWYDDNYVLGNYPLYLCVQWADSRRRDIYSRLINYGFKFMQDEKSKVLMKRIDLPQCSSG